MEKKLTVVDEMLRKSWEKDEKKNISQTKFTDMAKNDSNNPLRVVVNNTKKDNKDQDLRQRVLKTMTKQIRRKFSKLKT